MQCATTAFLFAAGDALSQQIVERRQAITGSLPEEKRYDYIRTARFAFFGGCISGPLICTWYKVLERVVRTTNANKAALYRASLDQFVFAPPNIALFFGIQGALEGKSLREIQHKLDTT